MGIEICRVRVPPISCEDQLLRLHFKTCYILFISIYCANCSQDEEKYTNQTEIKVYCDHKNLWVTYLQYLTFLRLFFYFFREEIKHLYIIVQIDS